jgi:hypothetical protein
MSVPAEAQSTQSSPATSPSVDQTVFKIPNSLFNGRCRNNEFLIGVDAETRRTPVSEPAGYAKSLLPKFQTTDQAPALRVYRAPYDDLHGKRVRFSTWIKTKNVDEWCGLEAFVFGKDGRIIASSDMRSRPIHGTTDWTQHKIVFDVSPDATAIAFATMFYGKGEMWSDDAQAQVVGPDTALTDADPWQKFSYYSPSYTTAPDPQVQHNGHPAICIASVSDAAARQWVRYLREEMDVGRFRGNRVKITIWMKSAGVTGQSGIGAIAFGPNGKVADEGQQGHRPLRGTIDWKAYTAVIDIPREATVLTWGAVMNGAGKLWVDVDSAQCVVDESGTHGL